MKDPNTVSITELKAWIFDLQNDVQALHQILAQRMQRENTDMILKEASDDKK